MANIPIDPTRARRLTPAAGAALLDHLLGNGEPPAGRRIFVNRSLRMESIRYVGFDLDWTLADYDRLPLERLTFRLAIERLIDRHGYPREVREARFRPEFPRRGLLIDKEAGTVLRMNRHRYVNLAYSGRERLDREELKRLYRFEPIHPASRRFYHLDSLFELPEANLYSELVELRLRRGGEAVPPNPRIFEDVRAAIDWVHAEGALKSEVLAHTDRYLRPDPELGLALQRLGLGRRRFILLTNSDWAYAAGLCSYLFDGLLPGMDSWRDLFDLVIVGSSKPDFFRVKRPFVALDDSGRETGAEELPAWGGVYSGGCLEGLMKLIGEPGEHVLYIGDHIYGDIVSSKQESTWRTALVVRELEEEIRQRTEHAEKIEREVELKREVARLGREMDHCRDVIRVYRELLDQGAPLSRETLDGIAARFDEVSRRHRRVLRDRAEWSERLADLFNPYWGSFFKQGTSQTRFAAQLASYACLYTSRVSNFAFYGSQNYFRVSRDPMMHELEDGDHGARRS